MVERTKLPSFIVTLGTLFVLKGAKLGFSKLIVDQIQVGRIDEGGGYEFWRKIFAAEWAAQRRTSSAAATSCTPSAMLGGLGLLVSRTYEMHFGRQAQRSPLGRVVFVAGLAAAVAGMRVLHATDSSGGNWLGGGRHRRRRVGRNVRPRPTWRYEALADRGALFAAGRPSLKPIGYRGCWHWCWHLVSAISPRVDIGQEPVLPVHRAGTACRAVRCAGGVIGGTSDGRGQPRPGRTRDVEAGRVHAGCRA